MGLYENIKKTAEMRHKSINQIENDLGLPRSSLAKYNSHVPSADKIALIAQYLDVSMDFIMDRKDEAQETINRITNNLSSITTPAVNVFEENYRKDPVFMDYIEMLYSLPPEDKTEVYNYITFKYLGIGKEKKDSRLSKEA